MSEIFSKLWRRMARPSSAVQAQVAPPPRGVADVPLVPLKGTSDRLFNREISDLLFIERVMEESANEKHPLFERVRFLSIAADVLDQFYAVRVAKLRRSAAKNDGYMTPDGMTAAQQLKAVTSKANAMMHVQQQQWVSLRRELAEHDITFPTVAELSDEDLEWLRHYFRSHFLHVLTPFTIDEEHPFPFIASGGMCAILDLNDGHILLPMPSRLPRFVKLPGSGYRFLPSGLMIRLFWRELVPGEVLKSFGVFQILRDNDLAREEMNDDLRAKVETGLRLRHKANVIRLKVAETMSEESIRFVAEHLGMLTRQEIQFAQNRNESLTGSEFIMSAPLVGLSGISQVIDVAGSDYPGFFFPPYRPRYPRQLDKFDNDCFKAMQHSDIVAHWPYESFDSVIRFLEQAAKDPDVVSIKQTLYRTSDESPIVEAMITAAENGKTVLAVVELEARDNEQSNIQLARKMETAGVQIVYGIIGLKIRCKATLVVRMEDGEAITYTHLGTGNYHPRNAKMYTDVSFFTRDQAIGHDTHLVFSYLTSEKVQQPTKLAVAPYFLRSRLNGLIDREVAHARAGRPAHICIKVNSLTDPDITEKLYEASEAGVQVDLIIRRHCVLRPGVPGMSSRIRVRSIVGRFLEHSRVYLFGGGQQIQAETAEAYFGSADLMERNLDERAEILVPVEDPYVRRVLVDGIMHANLRDDEQSWVLDADNVYHRLEPVEGFSAQRYFMQSVDQGALGEFSSVMPRLLNSGT
ncbi:MAG: polyphosphate kinase 1 [Proteobacteria bacterium]|nr:polyphosphate kinase 1 [Pseudomonadota bacterium]